MGISGRHGYRIMSSRWGDFNKMIGKELELEGVTRRQVEFLQARGYAEVLLKNLRSLIPSGLPSNFR